MRTVKAHIRVEVHALGEGLIVTLIGQLTQTNQPRLIDSVTPSLTPNITHVLIDVRELDWLDSYGVGQLVLFGKAMESQDRKVALVNPYGAVKLILTNLCIGEIIPIFHAYPSDFNW